MNRKTLKNKWQQIKDSRDANKYSMLRLCDNLEIKLFVGITENDERAFVIYSNEVDSIDRSPVAKQNITLDIKEDAVIILLTNFTYEDIFDDLILSIYFAIDNENEVQNHLSLFMSKYVEWATFFRDGNDSKLSFENLIGLYGELVFLQQSLLSINKFDYYQSLSSWRGPFGAVHDFIFETHDVEVKTKLCTKSSINISSIYQLAPEGSRQLNLSIVNLIIDSENGASLYNLICTIRDTLVSDTRSLEVLYRALLVFDITIESSTIYDNYRFTVDSVNIYDTMSENFPKLIQSNTNLGISSLRYKIDTKALKPFKIR